MESYIHAVPIWFEIVSLVFCTGSLVIRLWVFSPASTGKFQYAGMWHLFGVCLAVLFMAGFADLLIRSSVISAYPIPDVFPILPTVLLKTHYGRVWIIYIAALTCLSAAFVAGRRHRGSRGFLLFMLVITLVISMTESASGHPSDAGDLSLAEVMDWLHFMAVSAWGGGLFALSLFVLPEILRQPDGIAPLLADTAGRFSKIAGVAVGVIVITAVYDAWSYVGGSVAAWTTTPYGLTVIVKIVLFLLLVNLGAFNRYVNIPLLREWAGASPGRRGFISRMAARSFAPFARKKNGPAVALRFTRSVRVEAIIIAVILACAALLRQEVPARHYLHLEHMPSMEHHHSM